MHYTGESLGGKENVTVLVDYSSPPKQACLCYGGLEEIAGKYRFIMRLGSHIGDGNHHPALGYDPDNPDETRRVVE